MTTMNHVQQNQEPLPTPALIALAAARDALVKATTESEAEHAEQTKRLAKAAELRAAAADALRAARANGDPDGKHAMAAKIAEADIADLGVVIETSAEKLTALGQVYRNAQAAAMKAEQEAKSEEHAIAYREMQKHVAALQESFVASVAELHRLWLLNNPKARQRQSTWACFTPTDELRALITGNEPPRHRV